MGENEGQEGRVWGHGMAFIVMVRQRKGIFRRGSNLEGIVMARFPFSPGLVEGGFPRRRLAHLLALDGCQVVDWQASFFFCHGAIDGMYGVAGQGLAQARIAMNEWTFSEDTSHACPDMFDPPLAAGK